MEVTESIIWRICLDKNIAEKINSYSDQSLDGSGRIFLGKNDRVGMEWRIMKTIKKWLIGSTFLCIDNGTMMKY